MATVTIQLLILSPAVTASVTSLYRNDTGLPPSGVSFPISLSYSAPYWTGSFTDPTADDSSSYSGTGIFTLADGNVITFPLQFVSGQIEVVSFWTSQPAIEDYIGRYNSDQLSNLDNTTVTANPGGFVDAITRAETVASYELRQFFYPAGNTSPTFPSTSYAYGILSESVCILASAWLYAKRGIYDESGDKIAGKFSRLKKDATEQIKSVVRNQIRDVSRNLNGYPLIVWNAALVPFGTNYPIPITGNMVPTLPGGSTQNGANGQNG